VCRVTQQQWSGPPQWGTEGQAPASGQSPFGQPAFGQLNMAQPGFAQPRGGAYGRSPYGSGRQFGQPNFGSPQGQPAGYPAGQFSPPRRRNPLKLLLLAMIGVALVAIVGLIGVSLLTSTSEVAYQNDDYQVPPADTTPPPIPIPSSEAEAAAFLTKNPIYSQATPIPVRCVSQPINVGTASNAQLKSHFEGLMECLVRVWQPAVEKAGFQIVRPTVTIYGREITTRCGKSGVNAFYCSGDQQLYYSNLLDDAIPIVAKEKWAADVVMAHEFGHELQGRTGVLVSAHELARRETSKAAGLAYLRRLETQADCYSGIFVRAVSTSLGVQQTDLNGIVETYEAVGDDVASGNPDIVGNHGLARSRKYWGTVGLGTSDVGKCNTFVASANLIR